MINYFNNKAKSTHHKAQISIFFIAIIATLIAITFVTIMIGKTAKDKTYASNAADAGALAGCSIMATGFNYVSDKNGNDEEGDIQKETLDQENRDIPKEEEDIAATDDSLGAEEETIVDTGPAGLAFTNGFASWEMIRKGLGQLINLAAIAADGVQFAADQLARLMEIGNNSFGSEGNQQNYHDNALSMAYKINFQNSGIHHRLGRLNQEHYDSFIEGIQPGLVQSGQPLAFVWVDGAARVHIVVAIIEIEKPNKWDTKTASQKLSEFTSDNAKNAGYQKTQVAKSIAVTPGFFSSDFWMSFLGDIANGLISKSARGDSKAARTGEEENLERQKNDGKNVVGDPKQLADDTPKQIDDIHHSRTVTSLNFQFHMGSPVKGIAGDIDVMTFYPPVVSGAIASFNYTGMGNYNVEHDENQK